MKALYKNSLQQRLVLRLSALFVVAALILTSVFFYLSFSLVETLSRRALFELADELADELDPDELRIDTDDLIQDGLLNQFTRYAVFDAERRVLVTSDDAFVESVLQQSLDLSQTNLFTLDAAAESDLSYRGLVTTEGSEIGRVTVVVAEQERSEQAQMAAMMRTLVLQTAWLLPLLILLTVLVAVLAIRSGLKPLRRAAQQAADITPETLSARLTTDELPAEVSPLVLAVNNALDRLEAGFERQRRFTANAAHELRTPLAIISSAIDGLGREPALDRIRHDIARMNRLVEQLMHVARLDGALTDVSASVDLLAVSRDVIARLAPIAIAQGHTIGLSDDAVAVNVRGNRYAIEDALSNLVENAIVHGSAANNIEISVVASGAVSVCDQGPGLSDQDKAQLFDRFWRGQQAAGSGAGLGLSIVREIMSHHGGSVLVNNNNCGGSCFTLQFSLFGQ